MKRLLTATIALLLLVWAWLSFDYPAGPTGITGREKTTAPSASRAASNPTSAPGSAAAEHADPKPPAMSAKSASRSVVATPPPRSRPITSDFVRTMASGPEVVSFTLPDGRTASGVIEQRHISADGSPVGVTGRLDTPGKGTFFLRLQPAGSPTGPVAGAMVIDHEEIAFRILLGPDQTSLLTELPVDQVICRSYALAPEAALETQEIPAEYPTSIPIPAYQNGVIPLQSQPGAVGVIYLDYDGEKGPHEGWSDFDAASPNASNTTIKDVWTRVAEDFAPFNVNVTTDLQVFLNAPETSRQRCIITPTTTAAPGAGGVAYVGSFGWSGDTPCWAFYSSGKNAAEVVSHEIGHTLGLSHDGRISPVESYYAGHGTDPVGWAPIMGVGYYKNLSQWSKGEYLSANQSQDDLAIIAANANVGYRADDAGATHATAALLEIFSGGAVDSEGDIETRTDVDAFRFTTNGGTVNLSISPVAASPDLDIMASIYDSAGNLVISNNPDTTLNATLSTTLVAGEYTVRVDGVGRGDPLVDGYSDYASLGQYTITGTINGAVVPDRFTIAENSPSGSTVGTPAARNNHAGAALTYSITSGNTGSAFSIDPATGAITVATPAALNYEALSTSWVYPPAFDLTVGISDPLNSALSESLRVVVSVSNVNEAPTLTTASSSIIAISHTVIGTTLGTVTATDPDPFDFPSLSIVSGDPSGKFTISQSGIISPVGDLDATVQSLYTLTIRATDQATPALTAELTVTVTIIPASASYTPGFAYHTIYDSISGSNVSNLTASTTFPTSPTREVRLSSFTDTTQGDTYGSTVRAWLIAPITGSYQFWIAGDDAAELYLSTAGNPASLTKICYLTSYSDYQQWTKYGTQASSTFNLTAGQVYYIEARHKENSGGDHLSVAWQIKDPSATTTLVPQQVISGRYLSPHYLNYAPKVTAATVSLYRNCYTGSTVTTAAATDLNTADSRSWAITAGNSAGIFTIDAATGKVTVANAAALAANVSSSIALTLTATDNAASPLSGSATLTVNLLATTVAPTAGLIQEFWDGVSGTALSSLYSVARYPNRPDRLTDLTSFDSGSGLADNYGARIRAYVIPPSTGSYTFYIASDDASSLLLSTDSNPANAVQIASVSSYTGYQSWTTNASQTSAAVTLTAGQRYFIEGRVKEGAGGDHLSVAWTGPAITTITLLSDANTEPYDSNIAPDFAAASYSFNLPPGYALNSVAGSVAASDSPFEEIRYAIASGDPRHAFSMDPVTGVITVGNLTNLSIGSTYHLQAGAQDSGHGRHFVPKETLVPVTVVVPGTNTPPQFSASPVALGAFPAGQAVSTSIASSVSDPGDLITFSLISGPAWVSLSSAGVISGTPGYGDFGLHLLTVLADDGNGHSVQGSATLTVTAPANISVSTLTASNATAAASTGTVSSGTSASASTSDNAYQVLKEASTSGTSALDYRWTFATTPNRPATLRVEAHHTANTEGDDFQFSVSTDGGISFTNAILVTKTADNNAAQSYPFTAGVSGSTIIKVVDTNRSAGNTSRDTLSIDLLALDLAGNTVPAASNATLQVASHAPVGVSIGSAATTDPDAGQILSYGIPRGNEAGFFAVSPAGSLSVAANIPSGAGPFSLIVVATDCGVPSLANYSTVTVNVVAPIEAPITFSNLTPTYNGFTQTVVATTSPAGLPVTLSYNNSPTPPTGAGSYAINAKIIDPIYTGTASATLTIGKAPATVTLSGLSQTYDGAAKPVTATTLPAYLAVGLTYDNSAIAPAATGTYAVVATVSSANYSGTSTGTLVITNNLTVAAGQLLVITGGTTNYQNLLNEGTLIIPAGTIQITENLTNHGTLRLVGDAILDISGAFTNTGVVDILNWSGSLPAGLVNTGTILDRTAIRVISTHADASAFTLGVPSFEGHLYQLETKGTLEDFWSPLGQSVAGTGSATSPPVLEFSPLFDGPRRFYRVVVTPAPSGP